MGTEGGHSMVAAVSFHQITNHHSRTQFAPASYDYYSEETSSGPDISPYSLCEPLQVEAVSARAPKEIERPT